MKTWLPESNDSGEQGTEAAEGEETEVGLQSGYSSEQLNKPLLPSVFTTLTRSLTNEMDELRLQLATNNIMKNGCIPLMTET